MCLYVIEIKIDGRLNMKNKVDENATFSIKDKISQTKSAVMLARD